MALIQQGAKSIL